ncbi:MAG: hypothetical protein MK106_07140 [Mariniblastus sp.]|nr:hypothetical protein [Mariniblastus sp.]
MKWFTATNVVHNENESELDQWAFRFISIHKNSRQTAWGCGVQTTHLGGGLYEYRLSVAGLRESIPVGGSICIGFTATGACPSVILENWMPKGRYDGGWNGE